MTERLYYADSRLLAFDAVVTGCVADDGRFLVRLDRTAFYPTSGGQPFDTGRLGGAAVLDVRDDDDDVVHVVGEPLTVGAAVRGEIDGERRRDHVQQHTGQHVLSAAFERACGVATVGFHMGVAESTIDLAREVSPAEIAAAEDLANRVIWEDRPVSIRIVPADEVAGLALRRAPARTGALRIVEVEDFDRSACGGTHVLSTAGIGIVVGTAWERVRGGTRLSFRCGRRVLDDYRALRDVAADAARQLSVAPREIGEQVSRLQEAARGADRTIRDLRDALAAARAVEWLASAETIGPCRVVIRADEQIDAAGIRVVAHRLTAGSGVIAVLVGAGRPAAVVAARSADVAFDAAAFMKKAVEVLGGRGGGKPDLAQGGLAAQPESIVEYARRTVSSSTAG